MRSVKKRCEMGDVGLGTPMHTRLQAVQGILQRGQDLGVHPKEGVDK